MTGTWVESTPVAERGLSRADGVTTARSRSGRRGGSRSGPRWAGQGKGARVNNPLLGGALLGGEHRLCGSGAEVK